MKYGVEIKIDVKKIDKAKLYEGKKGTYLSLTTFIDVVNKDQYDNNGFVKQSGEKDEDLPILGNVKVFWSDGSAPVANMIPDTTPPGTGQQSSVLEEDIPF